MVKSRFSPSTLKPDNLHPQLPKPDKVRPWSRFWPVLVLTHPGFDRCWLKFTYFFIFVNFLKFTYSFQIRVVFARSHNFFKNKHTFFKFVNYYKICLLFSNPSFEKKLRIFFKSVYLFPSSSNFIKSMNYFWNSHTCF